MEIHPYLKFSFNNSVYGISTLTVEEIFFLPELTPIPEAPRDLVGVVNLRGCILPVIDLNLRFGYQSPEYKLTDSVIIVRAENLRVGIIVNEVHEVIHVSSEQITTELSHGTEVIKTEGKKFITGIARTNEDILILLNAENLLRYDLTQELILEENLYKAAQETHEHNHNGFHVNGAQAKLETRRLFCPNATTQEREIFRQRAQNLKEALENEDLTFFKPLTVVSLNNEFFAIHLKAVKEFTEISKVTPIPCSPPHIVGNMNLRGEIITLIDIRGLLNLPLKGNTTNALAIIVEVEGFIAGITVEEVFDVMFLNPQEITPVPTAINKLNSEYLEGAAPYQGKMMSILNLSEIFLNGDLIVDEVA